MFRERIQFLVALLLVVNGSLWSFQAAAVTLGEIELKSGLGEALRATIELVDDKNIDSNSFSAQLETGSGTRGQEVVDQLDLSSLSFQANREHVVFHHSILRSFGTTCQQGTPNGRFDFHDAGEYSRVSFQINRKPSVFEVRLL